MTVVEKSSRKVIVGAGWVNPLTHNFEIESASQAHVFADTEELVQGVDYSVSGVLDPAGYSITITNPALWAPVNWALDVRPPIDQGKDLTVGGTFGAKYEDGLDKLARRLQRVYDLALRGLKTSLTTPVGSEPYTLPNPLSNAFIGWNTAATALENKFMQLLGTVQVIDEDDMHSNDATKVPTQQSVKAYVDNKNAPSITDTQFAGGAGPLRTLAQNSAAINAAIAYCAANKIFSLNVGRDIVKCNNDISNKYGVGFYGVGSILLPSGEKLNRRQKNYKGFDNFQHLWYAHNRLITRAGRIRVVISGDSTAEGGGWQAAYSLPQNYLKLRSANLGAWGSVVDNYGIGGTGAANWFASNISWVIAPVVNPTPEPTAPIQADAFILCYGANDGDDIVAYEANQRAILTYIRGIMGVLITIIIRSTHPMTDSYGVSGAPHFRDEQKAEKFRQVNLALADEFGCAHQDIYSWFSGVRGSDGPYIMESLGDTYGGDYKSDAFVHPRTFMALWSWEITCQGIWEAGIMANIAANAVRFYGSSEVDYVPIRASLPGDFKMGTEYTFAANTAQWTYAGIQVTVQSGDGYTRQENWSNTAPWNGAVRYGFGSVWGLDFVIGAQETTAGITINAPFVTGAAGNAMRAVKSGRAISVEGFLTQASATIANNALIFTFPAGLRPKSQQNLMCVTSAGETRACRVATNGEVRMVLATALCTSIEFIGSFIHNA